MPELKDSVKLPDNYTDFSWIDITNGWTDRINLHLIYFIRAFSHMDEDLSLSEIQKTLGDVG